MSKDVHPFQDHIDVMSDLIKHKIRSEQNGYWMETLSLAYVILEVELRVILTSMRSKSGGSVPLDKIERQQYLMNLANLTKDNGFIDPGTWNRIKEFNEARKKAIHGLAQGEVSYKDLKEPASSVDDLIFELQNYILAVQIGPETKA